MKPLPALHRPVGDPGGFGIGTRVFGGWRYVCVDSACDAVCTVRRRWSLRGNKHNGWGVYMTPVGVRPFCSAHAVAETRRRAAMLRAAGA